MTDGSWDRASFPHARWGAAEVEFRPESVPSWRGKPEAVVVMARADEGYVLALVERGWTVPSGRIEMGETPEEAAVRETAEEIGAVPQNLHYIGHYLLRRRGKSVQVVPTYACRVHQYGAIPPGSESRDARAVPLDELEKTYWRWDALLQRMFNYSEAVLASWQPVADCPDKETNCEK